jgi:flavin reductase ActVB
MSLETTQFLSAMSRVPGPVTVTTTVEPDGRRHGFTGSAFSSLSLDPPLVLVCLAKTASTHHAFTQADEFLVNLLSAEHSDVALRFAKSGVDRFSADDMQPCEFGLPGLPGAAARLACRKHAMIEGGDHSILIGRVEDVHLKEGARPLVYCNRSFSSTAPVEDLVAAS